MLRTPENRGEKKHGENHVLEKSLDITLIEVESILFESVIIGLSAFTYM